MLKKVSALLLAVLLVFGCTLTTSASESTAYTYTISVDGDWIRTQDAYMPGGMYLRNAGLKKPSDIFIFDDHIYVADTENARIVIYSLSDGSYTSMGEGTLAGPTGIFVNNEKIYVADQAACELFIFDKASKQLVSRIAKPDSYLFGSNSVYQPKNVAVSSQGNIFIVGTGAHEGLMQFEEDGTFQGYFAANKRSLTFLETIQDLIYTKSQKQAQLIRTAQPITNIDITGQDLIFSVTQGESRSAAGANAAGKTENYIKLHNVGGTNILSKGKSMNDEWNFVDICSGLYGNCYALTQTGLVYEYDSSGNLIFSFGGRAMQNDRSGLFTDAAAIDTDSDGYIYVLDKERGLIQVFYPTDFAAANHRAIYELENGNYEDSEETWEAILKLNGMSKIAHLGFGKTMFYQGRYAEAMEHFKIVNDKSNYSKAYWEIRSMWLNKNIGIIGCGAAVFLVAALLFGRFRKRKRDDPYKRSKTRPEQLWVDVKYSLKMVKHPIDTFYYLKHGQRGSMLSATIIFILVFIVFAADMLLRGFIFNFTNLNSMPPVMIAAVFAVPLFLMITGNYMVSSINDGEGSFKNIYVMTAYSMVPYMLITPFVILASFVLTQNEAFLISFPWTVSIIWSAVLMFIGIMEIHAYSFWETVKNILLTLFFMIVAVVTFAIIYIIWGQVVEFFREIIGEAGYRVAG